MVTLRQWETHHNSKEVPKYEVLIECLRDQCAVSQSIVPVNPNIDDPRGPRLSATHAAVEMAKRTLPISPVEINLSHLSSDLVADPSYGKPGPIDMIIGAGVYYDLLEAGKKRLSESGPTLQETVFGWVISGRVSDQAPSPCTATYVSSTVDLQELIARFWELEACKVSSTHSLEETACEELFERTTIRDAEGKLVVTLPKRKLEIVKLGESKSIAQKRFASLERKLDANPELKAMYVEFIHEYLLLGHMKKVDDELCQGPVYYLPHHAVIKPESTTTKLRVVFVGAVVQDDLFSIISRFRFHRFAFEYEFNRQINIYKGFYGKILQISP
ncbi:uncharacterized protein LOC129719848 [Wyeomyia smithii]|uniref:uncharacterized protein LOC129719848 n=1 Tax=Wyeomyia smithii TaxID=174621 RepID=UPI0024681112|nr:uncharacterized protein LOC129719848 [Wyeomyia smithii]